MNLLLIRLIENEHACYDEQNIPNESLCAIFHLIFIRFTLDFMNMHYHIINNVIHEHVIVTAHAHLICGWKFPLSIFGLAVYVQ